MLEPVRKFFAQQALEAEFQSKVGPVAATIAELAAQSRFDLVVMGSHGHSSLATLVLVRHRQVLSQSDARSGGQ